MLSRSLRHRAPLLWIVAPLIGGLVVGKLLPATVPPGWLIGVGLLNLLAALIWRQRPLVWAAGLCAGVLFSGVAFYELRRARLDAWERLPPREAQLILAVERVFKSSDERRVNGLAHVVSAVAPLGELVGQRISFSLRRGLTQEIPLRSEEIKALGVLQPLARDVKPDSFDAYLANAGVNFIFSRGRILATTKPAGRYQQFCERGAKKLSALLGLGVEGKRPELTAIYRAMMLGQKQDLSPDQDVLFMRSGTMHLFAINGLHIGVVALALHVMLSLLRCPRILIVVLTLAILWLDVETTK
jgi:competence protein ComEC